MPAWRKLLCSLLKNISLVCCTHLLNVFFENLKGNFVPPGIQVIPSIALATDTQRHRGVLREQCTKERGSSM